MIANAFKAIKELAETQGHIKYLVIDLKRHERSKSKKEMVATINKMVELLEIPEEDIFY
jgi:hypothetical protein